MSGKRVFLAWGRTWLRVRKWSNNRKVWTGKEGKGNQMAWKRIACVFLRPRVPPINRSLSKCRGCESTAGVTLHSPEQLNSFQVPSRGDPTYHISPPVATLTKTIKRSQRSAEENDSRLALRIYCVKTNYNRVVLKTSHLGRLATNKSLNFGL